MDTATKQARELVIVELRDGDGPWYWDGLTWNGTREKAMPMERGRAEILVAQTRRRIADGMTRGLRDFCSIVELEQKPAVEKPLTARQVARDLKQLLGADVAMTPMRWREEDR